MALLSPQDEATLKDHLSVIGNPVQLVLFTQTVGGSETGLGGVTGVFGCTPDPNPSPRSG